MSQNLINAIDLPSGSLPTTPVVIKDNDLAGMFNTSDYKYYGYGIPELKYRQFNGNDTVVKSTNIIQAVENGYYPIIVVSSEQQTRVLPSNGEYPSSELSPGIWGFSYYFYYNNEPMVMFTCLQAFNNTAVSYKINNTQLKEILIAPTDYLGTFDAFVVNSTGYWNSTISLFSKSSGGIDTGGGGNIR